MRLTINEGAFDGCRSLQTIQKNSNITFSSSFSGCIGLEEILGEGSLNYIGFEYSSPFSGCVNLHRVQLSSTNSDGDTYYESNKTCNNFLSEMYPYVEEIIISNGTSKIGKSKFEGCGNLKKITIPSSIKIIGNGNASSSLESVYISDLSAWCNIRITHEMLGDRQNLKVQTHYGVGRNYI